MREALWPEGITSDHAREVGEFFAGKLSMPLEVLLAIDDRGAPVGFACVGTSSDSARSRSMSQDSMHRRQRTEPNTP